MHRRPRGLILIAGLLAAAGIGWWQRDALLALQELWAPEVERPSEIRTVRQRARAAFDQAAGLFAQRRYDEARVLYEHAAADYERAIDPYNQAISLGNAGACEINSRRPGPALAYYVRAIALYDSLHEHKLRLDATLSMADALEALGRVEEARRYLAQAYAIASQTLDDPVRTAQVALRQGELERDAGRSAVAAGHFEQALAGRGAADAETASRAAEALVQIAIASGEPDKARELLDRLLAQTEASGSQGVRAAALGALGQLDLKAGRAREARKHLDEAARLYARLNQPLRYADVLVRMAQAEEMSGDLDRASQTVRIAVHTFEEHGANLQAARATYVLGTWAARMGRDDEAAAMLESARSRFEALGQAADSKQAEEALRKLAARRAGPAR